MTIDLHHNVVSGFEDGFPDLIARPDLNTLVPLPWHPSRGLPRGPGGPGHPHTFAA